MTREATPHERLADRLANILTKLNLDVSHLGKIMPKDIKNFAKLSGISHLYPSLDISFLKELLDSRANQVYSAKGYAFEDAAQFADIFKVLGNAIQNSLQVGFFI